MLFLSHSGEDSEAARRLAVALRDAGIEVWLDLDKLAPGDRWMEVLERALKNAHAFAVYVGKGGVRKFVDLEVRSAILRQAQEPEFRLIPILGPGSISDELPLFLRQMQWLDLRNGLDDARELARLETILRDQPSPRRLFLEPEIEPFRGLLHFDAIHAELFFGRDHEVEEILRAMQRGRFLAVVGDSGSGKSSLIRAGLIPALHRGRFHDGRAWVHQWRTVIIRPGNDLEAAFVHGLMDLVGADPQERIKVLPELRSLLAAGSGPAALADAVIALSGERNPVGDVILIVDQLEELFTSPSKPSERQEFVERLLHAANFRGKVTIRVLATLRADFYSRCWDHPPLEKWVAASQYPVRRMERDRLIEIIERPLQLVGARLEAGLLETLLHDLGEEPGQLPLLEQTLLQLWQGRQGDVLTAQHYEAIGRLRGALSHHAEELYQDLTDSQKSLARKIFVELTHVAEGARDTRRRLAKPELLALGQGDQDLEELINRLIEARLVTTSSELLFGGEHGFVPRNLLEISHEALIHAWPRFRQWVEESRDEIRRERKLRETVADWQAHGRDPSFLLVGARLEEAEDWALGREISADIQEYLRASAVARDLLWREEAERLNLSRQVLRLSDFRILRALERQAETLWPADPDRIGEYRAWIDRSNELLERLTEHRSTLAEIRNRAFPDAPCASHSPPTWTFTRTDDAWWHDTLTQLIAEMEAFSALGQGAIASVKRRLRFAENVTARTLTGEAAARWKEALRSIADPEECPRYDGLRMAPQLGLLPIGRDRCSGLWEFAHVLSGEPPDRDPQTRELVLREESAIVLILIPGGAFWMGTQKANPLSPNYDLHAWPDENMPHQVKLAPFFLSKYQMTQGQWLRFTDQNPSLFGPAGPKGGRDYTLLHPVERVSWEDCHLVLGRMGLALPTEAQWEYAARGGTDTVWWTGDRVATLAGAANLADRFARENGGPADWQYELRLDDGWIVHAPVDRFKPNPFGLYSVHGNVWEWCRDYYLGYAHTVRESDGERVGDASPDRVFRGGAFNTHPVQARSARRLFDVAESRSWNLGVRPARAIAPPVRRDHRDSLETTASANPQKLAPPET
jgi:formylglycine-generating enzyme required for sulfatase activity/energy-coupling factor transporter ATP-binding protein EcfA2